MNIQGGGWWKQYKQKWHVSLSAWCRGWGNWATGQREDTFSDMFFSRKWLWYRTYFLTFMPFFMPSTVTPSEFENFDWTQTCMKSCNYNTYQIKKAAEASSLAFCHGGLNLGLGVSELQPWILDYAETCQPKSAHPCCWARDLGGGRELSQ